MSEPHDVLIIGGGPAGLAAGLWLARYRRRVQVVDAGAPRNHPSWAVHGYPGLPDMPPEELRRRFREQALGAGAELASGRVTAVEGECDDFRVTIDAADTIKARRLLLAFGLRDELPTLPGLLEAYGTSVFHCPDCDGPSTVGADIAVYGHDNPAAALALYLLTWAGRVTLLTDGREPAFTSDAGQTLTAEGIAVREEKIARLDAPGGHLRRVELETGPGVAAEALFFHLGVIPGSDLGTRLGCRLDEHGHLAIDSSQETSVKGVYAAGDIAGPPFLASSAAASGVRAALSMHRSLLPARRRL